MKERKKGKQPKKDSKLIYKIIIPVLLVVSILIVGIGVIGFNPYAEFGDEYIFANDLVKNFNIDSFDGVPVSVSGVTSDNKMKFEIQAAWTLDKDDVVVVDNYLADNETLILRYKIAVKTKFNAFTTLTLMQCAGIFKQKTSEYLAASYDHDAILPKNDISWEKYINWTYYDFGDIKVYNEQNNYFKGDVEMSFDIAQNLLPSSIIISDDSLTKKFDYIAVSSAGVISSDHGKLSDVDLSITSVVPEDDSMELEEYSENVDIGDTAIGINWNINPELETDESKTVTAGGGILPQSDGSSLNPRNKDGSAIWDVVNEQVSMKDCKLLYHIGHLSSYVEEYYGTLSYTEITAETSTNLMRKTSIDTLSALPMSYTEPVALHVSNRYIQSEIQVVFDVYTSYNIVVAETDIEDYELAFPQEFYDLVAWLTAVEGIGGGKTYTSAPEGLFSTNDLILIIIIIVVVIIGIYIFYKVVSPMIKESQQRKTLETAMGMGMRR